MSDTICPLQLLAAGGFGALSMQKDIQGRRCGGDRIRPVLPERAL